MPIHRYSTSIHESIQGPKFSDDHINAMDSTRRERARKKVEIVAVRLQWLGEVFDRGAHAFFCVPKRFYEPRSQFTHRLSYLLLKFVHWITVFERNYNHAVEYPWYEFIAEIPTPRSFRVLNPPIVLPCSFCCYQISLRAAESGYAVG
jgi:hypothetical protein